MTTTLERWTGRLSTSFVLAAAGFTGLVFSQSQDGKALAENTRALAPQVEAAFRDASRDGQKALDHLMASAQETLARDAARSVTTDAAPRAELPFQILASAAIEQANDPYRQARSSQDPELAGNPGAAQASVEPVPAPMTSPKAAAPDDSERVPAADPFRKPEFFETSTLTAGSPRVMARLARQMAQEATLPAAVAGTDVPAEVQSRDLDAAHRPGTASTAKAGVQSQSVQVTPASPTASGATSPKARSFADGQSHLPDLQPDVHPVEARIRARVPHEMSEFFDLYLYVSKAEKGDWSQRMYVLAEQKDKSMKLLHEWRVSTGKEEPMRNPHGKVLDTDTPEGFFRLDRARFFEDYTSRQWQSPMPYAMFFDWIIQGRVSGLAIHGTGPTEEQDLGKRASKGCVRLHPEDAETLYRLVTENYAGKVPLLKVDPVSRTQSTKGLLQRDSSGRVRTKDGYRVLVIIENYGGPSEDSIATLM